MVSKRHAAKVEYNVFYGISIEIHGQGLRCCISESL